MSENQIMGDDIPLQPTVDQLNYRDTPDLITDIKLEPPDCEGTKIEFVDASQILPETQTVPVLSSSDASNDLKLEIKLEPQETIVKPEEIDIKADISEGLKSLIKTENEETELNMDMESEYSSTIKCEDSMDVPDERAISADLREEGYDKTGQKEVGTKYGNNQGSKISKQKFSCPECLYQTFQKIRLTRHMHRHKNIEVDLFKCSECTYQALQKNELDRHMLVHQDPNQLTEYKCDHCDYKTIRRSNLSGHMSRHKKPGRVKMLRCKECNYQAFDNSSIKRHIQKLHMATYRGEIFKCTNCDYKTIMIGDFNKHILIHEDNQCDQCDFKSKQKSHLIVHMRRHNTPRSCNECDFQASDNRSVKRHIRRFHMASYKGEIFKCSKCDYKTILKEDLKKHLCAYL